MSLLAGIAGGLAGGLAMNMFARAVSSATDGREAHGAAPGCNRVGRGMQPPQAAVRAEDDAAVRVGKAVHRIAAGSEPPASLALALGTAAHYTFSAALGLAYALIARRYPLVRAGRGTAYGAAVWVVADELVMPALRLSRDGRHLPLGIHAYALAGHLIYGITLDISSQQLSNADPT